MAEMTIEKKGDKLFLHGTINFQNVMQLFTEGVTHINQLSKVIVDLIDLEASDSSGLALLVGWLRVTRQQDKAIEFCNIPSDLQNIMTVYGLKEVLTEPWEN
jgi:phospholipid transport system transporter-binding protein